jgi:serine/threonine protein kinase
MNKLLALDPNRRASANAALKHPFFSEEPQLASLDSFPTWPSKSESKALVPTKLNLRPTADKSGLLPLDRNKQQLLDELEIDPNSLAKNGFSLNLGVKK